LRARPGRTHLGSPPADLAGFPRYRLRAGTTISRIHSRGRDPWWFGNDGSGRFDLSGAYGTCYLAQRAEGALLKVFKDFTLISEADIQRRHQFETEMERDRPLANCCAPSAGRFGVNAELHSTANYSLTQAWAEAFRAAGFQGVRYFLRSDPSALLVGYALFDLAGAPAEGGWPNGISSPISAETIDAAERRGLRFLPTP
jgi:hypothetical protein